MNFQCAECKIYVLKDTGSHQIEVPDPNAKTSHGLCKKCSEKVMRKIDEMEDEEELEAKQSRKLTLREQFHDLDELGVF